MVSDQDLYMMRPVAARIDIVAEGCWQTTVTRIDEACATYEQTLPTRYYFSGAVGDVARCELHRGSLPIAQLLLCYFRIRPFEIRVPYERLQSKHCPAAAE